MSVSHDVLAAVFLEGGFGFDPVSLGRLVATDRTCRQLAGSVWRAVRLGQVRRILTAYFDLVTTGFPYGPPPTAEYMLLRMTYMHILLDGPKPMSPLGLRLVEQLGHDPDDRLALSPVRIRLAEQIKRILGTAETVTAANCGSILLDLDASTPALACAPPEPDCESDDVPSDAESAMSYDSDRPHDDADIETWGAYWALLVRRRDLTEHLFRS